MYTDTVYIYIYAFYISTSTYTHSQKVHVQSIIQYIIHNTSIYIIHLLDVTVANTVLIHVCTESKTMSLLVNGKMLTVDPSLPESTFLTNTS